MVAAPPPTWIFRLFAWTAAILGTPGLLVGLSVGVWSASQGWGAVRTQGTVVDVVAQESGDGDSYVPVVDYSVDGKTFTCRGAIGFSPPMHKIGQQVQVLYRPDHPEAGHIDSFLDRWVFPLMFTVIGGMFSIGGICVLIWTRKSAVSSFVSTTENFPQAAKLD